MVLLTMPSASCDADATANGDDTLAKGHVALCFDHLEIRRVMVLLTMLFVSHDVSANDNGII